MALRRVLKHPSVRRSSTPEAHAGDSDTRMLTRSAAEAVGVLGISHSSRTACCAQIRSASFCMVSIVTLGMFFAATKATRRVIGARCPGDASAVPRGENAGSVYAEQPAAEQGPGRLSPPGRPIVDDSRVRHLTSSYAQRLEATPVRDQLIAAWIFLICKVAFFLVITRTANYVSRCVQAEFDKSRFPLALAWAASSVGSWNLIRRS